MSEVTTTQTEERGLEVTIEERAANEVYHVDAAQMGMMMMEPEDGAVVNVDTSEAGFTLTLGQIREGAQIRVANTGGANTVTLQGGEGVTLHTNEAELSLEAAEGAVATLVHVGGGDVKAHGDLVT